MATSGRKKILIVDDEVDVLKAISTILERANYEVITTTKGKEVIALAKEFMPDLIILDVLIPDMRGEEIKRLLSQDVNTSGIPTVFLTGILTKDDERFLKSLTGQTRSLAKPVTREELLQAVENILS